MSLSGLEEEAFDVGEAPDEEEESDDGDDDEEEEEASLIEEASNNDEDSDDEEHHLDDDQEQQLSDKQLLLVDQSEHPVVELIVYVNNDYKIDDGLRIEIDSIVVEAERKLETSLASRLVYNIR